MPCDAPNGVLTHLSLWSFLISKDVSNAERNDEKDGGNAKKHRSSGATTERRSRGRGSNSTTIRAHVDAAATANKETKDSSTTSNNQKKESKKNLPVLRRSNRFRKENKSSELIFISPPNRLKCDSYQFTGNVDNLDEREATDPFCATEYVQDMYERFREKELSTTARLYMHKQPSISARMRAILVDWLVEVHMKFKLHQETLYLAVNLVDRFLAKKEVPRKNLQLVGVTSLMIAAKYEEIYPLDQDQLVYICDNAYTRDDLLDMEYRILKTLDYGVTIPTAFTFLVRFLKAAHADKTVVQLSTMILDETLLCYNLLEYIPSQLAAATIALARNSVGRNIWSPTLLRYAYYSQEEVTPVARAILSQKSEIPVDLRSVFKKYSSPRFGSVAGTHIVPLDRWDGGYNRMSFQRHSSSENNVITTFT